MRFDVMTLAVVLGLVYALEGLLLFIQYKLTPGQKGLRWWVFGSLMTAAGFALMPFVAVKALLVLSILANPALVLGSIGFFVGVQRFMGKPVKKVLLIGHYVLFLSLYSYFLFVQSSILFRTVVVSMALGLVSVLTAFSLFNAVENRLARASRFTGMVFMLHGVFLFFRGFMTLSLVPITSYQDMPWIQVMAFMVPIFSGILWTFGWMIMIQHRINGINEKENEKFIHIFNLSPDAAVISRLEDGAFIEVNEGFLNMFGYGRHELLGNAQMKNKLWSRQEDREKYIETLQSKGRCKNVEFVLRRKNGTVFTGLVSSHVMIIHDEAHVIDIVRDVTETKMAMEILHESEETYRSILYASPDDITITDMQGNILLVSQAAEKMFGYHRNDEALKQLNYLDLIVSEDRARAFDNMRSIHQEDLAKTNEYTAVRKDGSTFNIEVNSGLVRDSHGKPSKMIFVIRDITARKVAEEQINDLVVQLEVERNAARFNAITDSMTGLFNRRYFDDSLYNEFHRLRRSGAPLSLVMLDVDHFKSYNDTYGHIAGDECLKKLGVVLKSNVGRIPDVVARYGGEEFIIILPETSHEGAKSLAENIRRGVEALAIPHATSTTAKNITVSLGVATAYPHQYDTPEQVVALADTALYTAKQNGRNRVAVGETQNALSNDGIA